MEWLIDSELFSVSLKQSIRKWLNFPGNLNTLGIACINYHDHIKEK